MSAYSIRQLPGERILVADLNESFDLGEDMDHLTGELAERLDVLTEGAYTVIDMQTVKVGIGDIFNVLGQGTPDFAAHPHLEEVLIVSDSGLVRFGTSALGSARPGRARTRTFRRMEDALQFARVQLKLGL
ncbi:MAG: hypothetical protein GYB64_20300 [Chloroflexi bacterium]|nr:hypothetical protein [Chloroflexota bacterium]